MDRLHHLPLWLLLVSEFIYQGTLLRDNLRFMKFEDYLKEEHANQYSGTDDEMPDDFDNWTADLTDEDWIAYATAWHEYLTDKRELLTKKI